MDPIENISETQHNINEAILSRCFSPYTVYSYFQNKKKKRKEKKNNKKNYRDWSYKNYMKKSN